MTISTDVRLAGPYEGNDVTVAFPFAFKIFSEVDLLVVQTDADGNETTLVLTDDYSVTLNADQDASPGGTVTVGTAVPSGELLTITSDLDDTQETDIQNAGGFFAQVIEDALDRVTILIQQLNVKLARAIKIPWSSAAGSELPTPTPNSVIGFDAAGVLTLLGATTGTSLLNLAAPSGASLIGFIQSGTGAVARTMEDKNRERVSIEDFGAVGDGVTDDTSAFTAAILVISDTGGDIWLSPGKNYVTSGGHVITSSKRVRIIGSGIGGTTITHTGNNIAFWFQAGDLLSCDGSGIFDLTASGPSTGSSATLERISDGWGLGAKRLEVRGYQQGIAFEVYNHLGWTEGWRFEDIDVRDALRHFAFNRSGSGTDTNSFGFGHMGPVAMNLNGGNNIGIYVPLQTGLPKTLYNCHFDLHFWYGTIGGGKRGIYVKGESATNINEISGFAKITCDSLPTPAGTDNQLVFADTNGFIDFVGWTRDAQGIQSIGSSLLFTAILHQANAYGLMNSSRAQIHYDGASLKLQGSRAAGSAAYTYSSGMLLPMTTYDVKLKYKGFSSTGSADFKIETLDGNTLPYVTMLSGLNFNGRVDVRVKGTASATCSISAGVVQNTVVVTNGGAGYGSSAPTVSFVGGGGSGAAATAVLTGGVVTSINVTSGGSGYTSAPSMILSPPLGRAFVSGGGQQIEIYIDALQSSETVYWNAEIISR